MPAAYFLANHYFRAGRRSKACSKRRPRPAVAERRVRRCAVRRRLCQGPIATGRRCERCSARSLARGAASSTALAQDARNADAILALADAKHRRAGQQLAPAAAVEPRGERRLCARRGRSGRRSAAAMPGSALVFDPGFSRPDPPPPFNWSLDFFDDRPCGAAAGRAAPRHFLRQRGRGARRASCCCSRRAAIGCRCRSSARRCTPRRCAGRSVATRRREPIAIIGIDQAARRGWTFQVPANCPAQWLELSGRSGDIAQQAEATITGFSSDAGRREWIAARRDHGCARLSVRLPDPRRKRAGHLAEHGPSAGGRRDHRLGGAGRGRERASPPARQLLLLAIVAVAVVAVQLIPLPPACGRSSRTASPSRRRLANARHRRSRLSRFR